MNLFSILLNGFTYIKGAMAKGVKVFMKRQNPPIIIYFG
jgi:hypothetical protein